MICGWKSAGVVRFVVRVYNRDDNAALNLRRQEPAPDLIRGLAADVEGVSDGRLAASAR